MIKAKMLLQRRLDKMPDIILLQGDDLNDITKVIESDLPGDPNSDVWELTNRSNDISSYQAQNNIYILSSYFIEDVDEFSQ